MPRKIRELVAALEKAGFVARRSRSSHRQFTHLRVPGTVTVAGRLGADAKPYQERDVAEALTKVET